MYRGMIKIVAVSMMTLTAWSAGSGPLYDEQADARQQIAEAIKRASNSGSSPRNIVLDFGANWCFDCHVLEEQMRKPELAVLIEKNFVVVKVDVGRYDKNLDLAEKYRVPLVKGIPALAVLDSRGRLLYAQDQGEFQDARHLSFDGIKAFFERWKPKR
ncbi:MAG: thioredoxin family protein [Terriglobia bacterium]